MGKTVGRMVIAVPGPDGHLARVTVGDLDVTHLVESVSMTLSRASTNQVAVMTPRKGCYSELTALIPEAEIE